MKKNRIYHSFHYKDSNFRICSKHFALICDQIIRQRTILEEYIRLQPDFLHSYTPLSLPPDAPEIAQRMGEAAAAIGVGPMAAVAGAIAQCSAEAALKAGATGEIIIENGGDLYVSSKKPVRISIYAGQNSPFNNLAFVLQPASLPLAVCSSSAKMGNSNSLGNCQLATVFAKNASLADAAATQACNLIQSSHDLEKILATLQEIDGIDGLFAICDNKIGLSGNIPPFTKQHDPDNLNKITKDKNACFPG
ncbi:MAG: UPF0280 family protein [Lentisphaeria bacterium]